MRRTRHVISALGILTALTALATAGIACGGGKSAASTQATQTGIAAPATKPADPTPGPAPTEAEGEQTVAISLTEWKITGPSGAPIRTVKAGEVNFEVHNDGTTQHEFVLFKNDGDPALIPVEDGKIDEDAAGASPGEADDIDAGQVKSATMLLAPGKYIYLCNVAGHYISGMHGQLIVE